jgi:hypothetical protein
LATITATTQGTHIARAFVPAPPLVRTTPATWGITYPPRPRPRFGASCAHTSQSSTDFSNRRLRRQAARPCVPVANSERSKLVQNPASSRKCRRSWPNERLRIANRASSAERTSCNQERGASAPRGKQNTVANRNRAYTTSRLRATRSGWRKPAVVSRNALAVATSQLSRRGDPEAVCTRTPLQLHYHTHGGLTPVAGRKRPQSQLRYSHPRRTDARRSCECAFVHRKNRFFAGRHSQPHTRAGSVSPPWVRYCDCIGVREHTAGSPPRLCRSVPASALP